MSSSPHSYDGSSRTRILTPAQARANKRIKSIGNFLFNLLALYRHAKRQQEIRRFLIYSALFN
jgi:hypothetical protein